MNKRIGLIGENSVAYIAILISIWNEGNCAVIIDWRIPPESAISMLKEAGVKTCFIETTKLNDIIKTYNEIEFIPYEKDKNSVVLLPEVIYDKFKENYSDDEAVIIYSSGTTGKSKGVILSHFAINSNADAIIDYMQPQEDDCIYIAKTISHSSTITGELLVALKKRIKLCIALTIVPPRFILRNINEFNVSIICLNPMLLSMVAEEYERGCHDLSSLNTIYVSGSILTDKVYRQAHGTLKNINIYNVYGLTEAGPRVTAQRSDCCKTNSVGKTIKNVEIKIIDTNGKEVTQGETGIIHIATPSLFKGYVSGSTKLKSAYNGWLNSGDLGYIDENGELHIVGRIDDMIIINAYKIYPSTIEEVINAIPGIKNSCVRSFKDNVLTCFYESSDQETITLPALVKECKKLLSPYEIPQEWIHVNELPKTHNGKINTPLLKKIFESKARDDHEWIPEH